MIFWSCLYVVAEKLAIWLTVYRRVLLAEIVGKARCCDGT